MRKIGTLVTVLVTLGTVQARAQWNDVNLTTPPGYVTSPFQGQPVSTTNPEVIVSGCSANRSLCAFSGIGIQPAFQDLGVEYYEYVA